MISDSHMAMSASCRMQRCLLCSMKSTSLLKRSVKSDARQNVSKRRCEDRRTYSTFGQYGWQSNYVPLSQRIQLALNSRQVNDDNKNRLFLLDGMDPIHRLHYGTKERTISASTGEDATILIGFMRHFFSLLSTDPMPTHCIVTFDAPGVSFRETMYPGYKANREEKPVEIEASVPLIKKALKYLGIKVVQIHGVEGDDAIGTLAKRFAEEDVSVYIFSRDKILSDNITFVRGPIRKGEFSLYTAGVFEEEYGFDPKYWVDALALQGDQADNIPGVYMIGEKRALKLVSAYGNLESIFKHASEVSSPAMREHLLAPGARDNAMLSRKLARIGTDLKMPPLRFDLEESRVKRPLDGGANFQAYLSHYDNDSVLEWPLRTYLGRTLVG